MNGDFCHKIEEEEGRKERSYKVKRAIIMDVACSNEKKKYIAG